MFEALTGLGQAGPYPRPFRCQCSRLRTFPTQRGSATSRLSTRKEYARSCLDTNAALARSREERWPRILAATSAGRLSSVGAAEKC